MPATYDGSPGLAQAVERREDRGQVPPSCAGRFGLVGPAGRPLPPVPVPSERAFDPPPPMAPWPPCPLALALALTLALPLALTLALTLPLALALTLALTLALCPLARPWP